MKKLTHRRGFSIIETLVAISILLLAIVGPMTIAAKSIQSAYFARDQIVAFYLAQEMIEYIRYMRDSNTLADASGWLAGLSRCIAPSSCGVSMRSYAVPANCTAPTVNCRVAYNSDGLTGTGRGIFYDENVLTIGGNEVATQFVRTAQITNVNANEAEIAVTVSWQSSFLSKTIVVRSRIFNHHEI